MKDTTQEMVPCARCKNMVVKGKGNGYKLGPGKIVCKGCLPAMSEEKSEATTPVTKW